MVIEGVANPVRNGVGVVVLICKTVIPRMMIWKQRSCIDRSNRVNSSSSRGRAGGRDVLGRLFSGKFHQYCPGGCPSKPICCCKGNCLVNSVLTRTHTCKITRRNKADAGLRKRAGSDGKVMAVGVIEELF